MDILGHYIFRKHRNMVSCRISMSVLYALKISENQKLSIVIRKYNAVNYFAKSSIKDVRLGFKCASKTDFFLVFKVNQSRYKQCGVTPHFSVRQILLRKYSENINIDIIN